MEATQNTGNPVWDNRIWRDAAYWERAWQQERRHSLYGLQQPERSGREWWDRRAEGFAKLTGDPSWRQRQDDIIQIFSRHDFLHPEFEILDIGCGTGNYALPLAGQVKKVVALDPSPSMLAILEQRAAEAGITNIETVCLTWEEIDLVERGWKERFGLVLAAMTPGVQDAETLRKMLAASNRGCYYNGLAWCVDSLQEALWRRLFHTEMPPIPADILHVFHLLNAWGYCPSLKLKRMHTRWETTRNEAVEGLAVAMAPYQEITPEIRREIVELVGEMARGAIFYQERNFVEGVLICDVNA